MPCVGVSTAGWRIWTSVSTFPQLLCHLECLILFLIMTMISALVMVSVATCLVSAKPTIYKVDEERNIAESILTPVSSTGRIPIEVNMKLNSTVCNLTLKVNISLSAVDIWENKEKKNNINEDQETIIINNPIILEDEEE